jgi:hypothetical protein
VSKYNVQYYSESKDKLLDIETMHPSHLLNAWKRYEQLRHLSDEERLVFEALDAEVKDRGLDKPREDEIARL